ncbi:hypothetical protein L208DRAFT_1235205, partial [Tricholoma matsutake]
AKKCKGSGGIQQYQDSKDCVATSNLKSHTMKCFGINAVNAAANKTKPNCHDGSIFALFACPGQQLVMISHQSCTNGKMRYAGCPGTLLPSPMMVSCDIKASFKKWWQHIHKLLAEHAGFVHFATDAWTSLNHWAFIAWTVHFHHQGHILMFLLDIIEVPEVCCQSAYFVCLLTFDIVSHW